ncbi:hypothetical protein ABT034_14965 [Streptomyces sp. NPDC002773]|uniref:hypothetical protein n=1 Tax=Streptomyces sp. NPDC002773 TaxID=3154430 RepID=UPI003324C4B4
MDTKTTTEKPADSAESAESAANADSAESAAGADAGTAAEPLDAPGTAGADEAHADETYADADADEDEDEDADDSEDELSAEAEAAAAPVSAGIGGAAAAVVSAALGAVALTGTWTGKVVSERETLIGQIKTSGAGTPAQQISEIYGDAWHSTALVNGVFALVALLVAVLVLILPGRPAWVRAVAVAGAVLGGLGLLLSAGTYFDLFLSLPTAGS